MKDKLLIIVLIVLLLVWFSKVLAKTPPEVPISPIATSTPLYTAEFERIAECESGHNLHAKNPHSSASGEFQWINSSWYHYGKEYWQEDFYTKNIWTADNRELAWYVYNKYGTKDWLESKWCWSTSM